MGSASVVVVGKDIDIQLAKFQQPDYAGPDNPWFVCVDMLALARARFAAAHGWLRHVDGSLHAPVDEAVWQQRILRVYPALPASMAPVVIPAAERPAFLAWVRRHYGQLLIAEKQVPDLRGQHKRGWLRIDAEGDISELVDRTMVEAVWSHWYIGNARAANGFFPLLPGATGTRGTDPQPLAGHADSALKGAIDTTALRSAGAFPSDFAGVVIDGRVISPLEADAAALIDQLPDEAMLLYAIVKT